MKKFILALATVLMLLPATSLAYDPSAICGWDFELSHQLQLPPTYCHAKQARGHWTNNGQLNLPCEGSACPVPNSVFNFLHS